MERADRFAGGLDHGPSDEQAPFVQAFLEFGLPERGCGSMQDEECDTQYESGQKQELQGEPCPDRHCPLVRI
jgi:hypothetical protein